MATYYADFDLGTGNNDGTSWANAWQTMADAIAGTNGTAPAAGDTIRCTGTDTLTSSPTLTVAGTFDDRISWIADDGAGNYTIGGAILDGNSTAVNALNGTNIDFHVFKGFKFTGATGIGVVNGYGSGKYFQDCEIYSNGSTGIEFLSGGENNVMIRCKVHSNTSSGVYNLGPNHFQYNKYYSNGGRGAHEQHAGTHYRCISYDNTTDGFFCNTASVINGCISDGNTGDGVSYWGENNWIINSIISNNGAYGIDNASAGDVTSILTAFYNNVSGEKEATLDYYEVLPDVTLTADPYESQSTGNYNLSTPNTELIGLELIVGNDGVNYSYETIGLPPEYSEGGGSLIGGSLVR